MTWRFQPAWLYQHRLSGEKGFEPLPHVRVFRLLVRQMGNQKHKQHRVQHFLSLQHYRTSALAVVTA